MSPTLQTGDLLILSRLAYTFSEIQVGDILAFDPNKSAVSANLTTPAHQASTSTLTWNTDQHSPPAKPTMLIKRCVLASEMPLKWQGSRLYIPYLNRYIEVGNNAHQSMGDLANVPDGYIFVLGDNIARSVDSRNYGLVPIVQVRGKAFGLWGL